MSDPHDLSERETACADGMCPLCMADRIEQLERERDEAVALLKEAVPYVEQHQKYTHGGLLARIDGLLAKPTHPAPKG